LARSDDFFDGSSLNRIPNNLKEWFFNLLDGDNANKIAARWDQQKNLIFWHFPSIHANPAGSLDYWICLNTRTGRWSGNTAGTPIVEMPIFTPIKVSGGLTYGSFTARYATYAAAEAAIATYGDLRAQNQDVSGVIGSDHKLQIYNGDRVYPATSHDFPDIQCTRSLGLDPSSPLSASAAVEVISQHPDQSLPGLTRPLSDDGWFNVSTARAQRFKMSFSRIWNYRA
jgi:hypothetical protein